MKAWLVGCESLGYVYARADTRGKAKTLFPAFHRFDCSVADLRSVRSAWLDGDGPARELDAIYRDCGHPNENSWGCPDCDDLGLVVDQEATIRANETSERLAA